MTGLRYAPKNEYLLPSAGTGLENPHVIDYLVRMIIIPAERVGFEPTVQFNPYDDLANRSFRPLRHLSEPGPV